MRWNKRGVWNKKGYIHILEAIIALVIVLAYVVSILPRAQQPTGKVPPELKETQKGVLQELQNDEKFRSCIVESQLTYKEENKPVVKRDDVECVNNLLRISFPVFSAWTYAFKICPQGETTRAGGCAYSTADDAGRETQNIKNDQQFIALFPTTTPVYAKQRIITVRDPTSPFSPSAHEAAPQENMIIAMYIWSTV